MENPNIIMKTGVLKQFITIGKNGQFIKKITLITESLNLKVGIETFRKKGNGFITMKMDL